MLPTPPGSQTFADTAHARMNDPAEDQKVPSTEAQQRSKRHKSNATDNPTRNQHRSGRLVEGQSELINQCDQDINVLSQYDQDADTNINAASEYAEEQRTADRRSRYLQVHGTQGDAGAAYHTDEDQTHAMEVDHDQDQGEDQCISMVYSNGQNTNTYNNKQRKHLRNKIKQRIKKKENKFYKKLEERKMLSDS
jgi:hypothetical protein